MIQKLVLPVVLVAWLLTTAGTARAGSIGGVGFGGAHGGTWFGANLADNDAGNDALAWIDAGGGAELTLGPRHGRLLGRARAFLQSELSVDPDIEAVHFGAFTFGLQVDLAPSPERPAAAYVLLDVGVTGLALYHGEKLMVTVGIGARRAISPQADLYLELCGTVLARNAAWFGGRLFYGIRVHFD